MLKLCLELLLFFGACVGYFGCFVHLLDAWAGGGESGGRGGGGIEDVMCYEVLLAYSMNSLVRSITQLDIVKISEALVRFI